MGSAARVVFLSPSVRRTSLFHYRGQGGVLCDQSLFSPSISRLTMAESHLSGGLLPLSLSPAANKHRLYAEFPYLTTFKSRLILSLRDICTLEFKMRHALEASPPNGALRLCRVFLLFVGKKKNASKCILYAGISSALKKVWIRNGSGQSSFDFKRSLPHVKAVMRQ